MKRMTTLLVLAMTVLLVSAVSAQASPCDFDVSGSVFGGDNPVTVELCSTCAVGPTLGPGDAITIEIFNKATCDLATNTTDTAAAGYLEQTVIIGEDDEGPEFSASLHIAPGSSGQVEFTMPADCDTDLDGVCANRVRIAGHFTSSKKKVPAMAVDITIP